MRIILATAVWILAGFSVVTIAQDSKKVVSAVPVLADADKTKIREFQLRDVRVSDAIKQRQLEIAQLQAQAQQNAKEFQAFVSTICRDDKYEFDMTSDVDLKCVPRKVVPVKVSAR